MLEDELAYMQDYTRIENLIIHGLPLQIHEGYAAAAGQESKEKTEDLLKGMTQLFDIMSPDSQYKGCWPISILHRLPTRKRAMFQPLVVRFYIRAAKNELLWERKEAANFVVPEGAKKISVAEHLGPRTLTLLRDCKITTSQGIYY